jgi:DNA-directed RNA polymerase subunit RPC12/RpoP
MRGDFKAGAQGIGRPAEEVVALAIMTPLETPNVSPAPVFQAFLLGIGLPDFHCPRCGNPVPLTLGSLRNNEHVKCPGCHGTVTFKQEKSDMHKPDLVEAVRVFAEALEAAWIRIATINP